MNMEITYMYRSTAFPPPIEAHVPQPSDPSPSPDEPPGIPPETPDEVDLPAREVPPPIDEPDMPTRERVSFWPGHRIVLDGCIDGER